MLKAQLRGGGGRRVGRGGVAGRAPVVRQQLREVALLERGQTLEDVLEVGGVPLISVQKVTVPIASNGGKG